MQADYENVEGEGKAYLLRPDIPKEGKIRRLKPGETEGGELSDPLKSYADEAGLIMRRSTLTPYTTYALAATEFAKEQGAFDPFHRAMYKAYWEDLKNIGDFEVIRSITEECGLDWHLLEDRLKSSYYEQEIMNQFQEGVGIGVRGIPGFVIGNVMFTGARPYGIFKAVMDKVISGEDLSNIAQ